MATIHNPSRFVPEDYAAIDYMDNRGPDPIEFFGFGPAQGAAEALKAAREEFTLRCVEFFGWRREAEGIANVPHTCDHCGAHIRYVVVAHHAPSGTNIAMGTTCAKRLEMSLDEHRIKNLKEVAERRNATIKQGGRYQGFLSLNPEFKTALDKLHAENLRNNFLWDIAEKAFQYGDLSERQISAFIAAVDRETDLKSARTKESESAAPAVAGRHEITGVVVAIKVQESNYGTTLKMLVRQADGAKYWGTIPSAISPEKGDAVSLTGTCEVSHDDQSFAFYKRPAKALVLEKSISGLAA